MITAGDVPKGKLPAGYTAGSKGYPLETTKLGSGIGNAGRGGGGGTMGSRWTPINTASIPLPKLGKTSK